MLIELLVIAVATWTIVFGLQWGFRKMTSPSRIANIEIPPLSGVVKHFPRLVSDEQILAFIDSWVSLLEQENYQAAYARTAHRADMDWSPELIRQTIKSYGQRLSSQKVTLDGRTADVPQRKSVRHLRKPASKIVGNIWYDLNIDGVVSDLTATFYLQEVDDGLVVVLDNIHVM